MKQLLLLGGGHSHVEVIRQLGLAPPPETRITLVSPDRHTPYSGMLPGFVSGHYTFGECHIDLEPLCRTANVAFQRTAAIALDPAARRVQLADGRALPYDVLSIDIGSTPPTIDVPGAREHALRVKPVAEFLTAWDAMREAARSSGSVPRIAVVGGGAGGVELALALHYRLQVECHGPVPVHVFTDTPTVLHGHASGVVALVSRILDERGIAVHASCRVTHMDAGWIDTSAGRFEADHFIWATGASAPSWLAAGGIETGAGGFIAVNKMLQSVSHPDIFAAGDVASMVGHRIPKSGVYAVRQGPFLAENLQRRLQAGRLRAYAPQSITLALISTGDRRAVASYGRFAFEGAWVWRWKDRIDRRFMQRYRATSQGDDGGGGRA